MESDVARESLSEKARSPIRLLEVEDVMLGVCIDHLLFLVVSSAVGVELEIGNLKVVFPLGCEEYL